MYNHWPTQAEKHRTDCNKMHDQSPLKLFVPTRGIQLPFVHLSDSFPAVQVAFTHRL